MKENWLQKLLRLADEGKQPYLLFGVCFVIIYPFAAVAFAFWFIFVFLAQFVP